MIEVRPIVKNCLQWGSLSFFLAIAAGAFGAHALKAKLTDDLLKVFETSVDYHYYISFSFFLFAILGYCFKINITKSFYFLMAALLLFCGNLYLYVLTANKIFAMIVPIGGVSFMISYLLIFTCINTQIKRKITN